MILVSMLALATYTDCATLHFDLPSGVCDEGGSSLQRRGRSR